jgi:hypothetical protein
MADLDPGDIDAVLAARGVQPPAAGDNGVGDIDAELQSRGVDPNTPPPQPTQTMSMARDAGRSLGTGLVRGGMAIPNTIGGLVDSAMNGLAYGGALGLEKLGLVKPGFANAVATPLPGDPDDGTITGGILRAAGGAHQPQTTLGQYAETTGEMIPSAVAFGARTLAQVPGAVVKYGVLPAVTSETGGQLAKGTPYETPARIGGALIGAAPGVAMDVRASNAAARATIPTTDALRAQANAAYRAADDAGVVLSRDSFGNAVNDIAQAATDAGIDRTIHPRATAALGRLTEAQGTEPTLQNVDTLRRVLRAAAASNEPDERRIANIMIGRLDDYLDGLTPADVVAGDAGAATTALGQARDLWSRFRKGEIIEDMIDRAGVRAPNFSGSGTENALRTEFRQLALNPRRMRMFMPDEQDAIRRVAMGGPIDNALRMIGKFAPTGAVSSALASGLGYMIGGPAGAAAVPAIGFAARQGATMLTRANAERAAALARAGGTMPAGLPLPATPMGLLFARSLLMGQQPPGLLAPQPQPGLLTAQ